MWFNGRRWRRKASFPRSNLTPEQLRAIRATLPFPEPPLNYKSGSRDKTLMRSLPPNFVHKLRSQRCAGCRGKFSSVRPAYVSQVCTHMLCPSCVADASMAATNYAQCPACRKDICPDYLIDGKIEYIKDANFLKVLKILETTPGFRCMDCGRLQPRHNSVRCVDAACGRRARFDARYSCVWCAKVRHRDCKLSLIEGRDQRPSLRYERNEWISSFDISHMPAWALVHCGLCLSLLKAPMPGKVYRYTYRREKGALPLECGHYACSSKQCHNGYSRCGLTEVYCHFCKKITTGGVPRFAPALSSLLTVFDQSFGCAQCASRNMLQHTGYNRGEIVDPPEKICLWCYLQYVQWWNQEGMEEIE